MQKSKFERPHSELWKREGWFLNRKFKKAIFGEMAFESASHEIKKGGIDREQSVQGKEGEMDEP